MIKLYKDGDHMAIETNERSEGAFLMQMSDLIQEMISDGMFIYMGNADGSGDDDENPFKRLEENGKQVGNDWGFQLSYWLPQIVDICCKYRGYKNNVEERTILIAGDHLLTNEKPIAESVESRGPNPLKVRRQENGHNL